MKPETKLLTGIGGFIVVLGIAIVSALPASHPVAPITKAQFKHQQFEVCLNLLKEKRKYGSEEKLPSYCSPLFNLAETMAQQKGI
jgi:hypothetical protein